MGFLARLASRTQACRVAHTWWHRYLTDTRSASFAVLATLPLVCLYGVGLVHASDDARSALDVVSGSLLAAVGTQRYLLGLAAVTTLALAVVISQLRARTLRHAALLAPLTLEACLYGATMGALILYVMERQHLMGPVWLVSADTVEHAVMSAGAAVHEELLFRAALMPALALGAERWLAMPRPVAWIVAIGASSLAFAGAHHLAGEPWDTFAFSYRTLAGVVFGALFVSRGFGAAAWTHATYDFFVLSGTVS